MGERWQVAGRRSQVVMILAVIALDQWTKHLVRLYLYMPRVYFGGLLTLVFTQNEGAFLSLGATLSPAARTLIFTIAVGVAVIIALAMLAMKRVSGVDAIAVAMIAAGGVGNLIDRLARHGRVTDFIYLQAGPLHTGVFNVADMAITGGVIWLLVSSFLPKPKNPPAEA
jgi:signal peptidase II